MILSVQLVFRILDLVLPLALPLLVLLLRILLGRLGRSSSSGGSGVFPILLLGGDIPRSERFEDLGEFELASEEEEVDDFGGLVGRKSIGVSMSVLEGRERRKPEGGRKEVFVELELKLFPSLPSLPSSLPEKYRT